MIRFPITSALGALGPWIRVIKNVPCLESVCSYILTCIQATILSPVNAPSARSCCLSLSYPPSAHLYISTLTILSYVYFSTPSTLVPPPFFKGFGPPHATTSCNSDLPLVHVSSTYGRASSWHPCKSIVWLYLFTGSRWMSQQGTPVPALHPYYFV